jgi:Homeodomain-like domain
MPLDQPRIATPVPIVALGPANADFTKLKKATWRRTTEETRAYIKQAAAARVAHKDICARLKISRSTVHRVLHSELYRGLPSADEPYRAETRLKNAMCST